MSTNPCGAYVFRDHLNLSFDTYLIYIYIYIHCIGCTEHVLEELDIGTIKVYVYYYYVGAVEEMMRVVCVDVTEGA